MERSGNRIDGSKKDPGRISSLEGELMALSPFDISNGNSELDPSD